MDNIRVEYLFHLISFYQTIDLNVIKYFFLGETSVYRSDVVTLFKLSSKSAITTASKFKPPNVYLCSSFLIFFSLFA